MKCSHCGKNDASCHYSMSVNGRRTELWLCGECAEELGIHRELYRDFGSMFSDFFNGGNLFGSMFDDDFGLLTSVMPRMEILLDGCSAGTQAPPETETKPAAASPSRDEDTAFSRRRELNRLRREMRHAAATENFEEAAKLRDRIRALEAEK